MSTVIDDFIKLAQAQSVAKAVTVLSLNLVDAKGRPLRDNQGGPCPVCQGNDRFSVSLNRNAWNCRGCGIGGKNGLGLVGHVLRYDLKSRSGLLEACSMLLREPIPEEGKGESSEEREARQARIAKDLADAEREAAERDRKQNWFRENEVKKARGIYLYATIAPHRDDATLRDYLRLRTGFSMDDLVFENIRFDARHTYWDGVDERKNPISFHVGFAMIAPFVTLDGVVTGSHETWIDLSQPPKFRPDLGIGANGKPRPTKKMRGTKMGSLIPICGDFSAERWVGGEGIETTAAVAGFEGFDPDTFYFATGDLGNMAGPVDHSSDFWHPTEMRVDRNGKLRRFKVAGPKPRPDQTAEDAYQVPEHVRELVHLADGDSELMFTAAALERAGARLERPGRVIKPWWPPDGMDFAEAFAGQRPGRGCPQHDMTGN